MRTTDWAPISHSRAGAWTGLLPAVLCIGVAGVLAGSFLMPSSVPASTQAHEDRTSRTALSPRAYGDTRTVKFGGVLSRDREHVS